ncbi:MAG: VCBS repeat-containing protein [Candidatus Erginobacter occultus]|nr:VCBS repeat-containing protein [Candidatus Erginobacter occultus]
MKRSISVLAVTFVLFVCLSLSATAQINEGFDGFQIGVRPAGWEFINCDRNADADMAFYGVAAPGIQMGRTTRSRIITETYTLDGAPGDSNLSFYLQAIAANPSSAIQVREYDSVATAWSVLTWLPGSHPGGGATIALALNASSSQQVEIEYLKAGGDGNVVIDDVAITNVTTAAPPAPPAPAPSPIYLVKASDDYSGDGMTDAAFYNPVSGDWQLEGIGTETFGGGEYDVPAPGDYDGDGIADLGYFDRGTGEWFAQSVSGGAIIDGEVWGIAGDVPVPGDYDGDGTTDLAVWRPSNGYWYVKNVTSILYGYDGVIPVPGDYTGDGATDIAVINTIDYGTWRWYVNGVPGSRAWGLTGDIPVPGAYVVGYSYLGAYRPSNNRFWWIRRDGVGGYGAGLWGQAGDVPVVGDFDGDGVVDLTAFRSPNEWIVRNVGTDTLAPNESAAVIVTGATGY